MSITADDLRASIVKLITAKLNKEATPDQLLLLRAQLEAYTEVTEKDLETVRREILHEIVWG